MIGAVVVNTMAGYALARLRFPGRALTFLVVLAILMVPLQAILIPFYLLVAQLGWLNSYQALIIPFIANPLLIFLMRQSFQTLPDELDDAAAVDGAGGSRLPQDRRAPHDGRDCHPGGLDRHVDLERFMIPVTFTTDPVHYVLTVGLNSLQSQFYTLTTVQMAGVVLLTVPIVLCSSSSRA